MKLTPYGIFFSFPRVPIIPALTPISVIPTNFECPRGLSRSRVIHVGRAALVAGDQHLSVLVGPEAVEVDEDAGDRLALTAVHQILQRELVRVSGLHHVEDLVLHTHTHTHTLHLHELSFMLLLQLKSDCLDENLSINEVKSHIP